MSRASTGVINLELRKCTLIVGWDVCYERGMHRLLPKQRTLLPNRHWSFEAIGRFYKGRDAW